MQPTNIDPLAAWLVGAPIFLVGLYCLLSAFNSRWPMPREWPCGLEGDISKPHVPISRSGRAVLGGAIIVFAFGAPVRVYTPWLLRLWIWLCVASAIAVAVICLRDWRRAPTGNSQPSRRGSWAAYAPAFWNNPRASPRTKLILVLGLVCVLAIQADWFQSARKFFPIWLAWPIGVAAFGFAVAGIISLQADKRRKL
jgi:hypothetical protein